MNDKLPTPEEMYLEQISQIQHELKASTVYSVDKRGKGKLTIYNSEFKELNVIFAIERWVRRLLKSDEVVFTAKNMQHRKLDFEAIAEIRSINNQLDSIHWYFPQHNFHPYIELFLHHANVPKGIQFSNQANPAVVHTAELTALQCLDYWYLNESESYLTSLLTVLNDFVQCLRTTAAALPFKREVHKYLEWPYKNFNKLNGLIESVFNSHQNVFVLRMDFSYKGEIMLCLPIFKNEIEWSTTLDASGKTAEDRYTEIYMHREKLIRFLKTQLPAPKHSLLGYAWRWEFDSVKQGNFHFLILLDGTNVTANSQIGKSIGDHWNSKITNGKGRYVNNNRKVKLPDETLAKLHPALEKSLGTGLIRHQGDPALAIKQLEQAALYMTLGEYYLKTRTLNKFRTFGKTRINDSPPRKINTPSRPKSPKFQLDFKPKAPSPNLSPILSPILNPIAAFIDSAPFAWINQSERDRLNIYQGYKVLSLYKVIARVLRSPRRSFFTVNNDPVTKQTSVHAKRPANALLAEVRTGMDSLANAFPHHRFHPHLDLLEKLLSERGLALASQWMNQGDFHPERAARFVDILNDIIQKLKKQASTVTFKNKVRAYNSPIHARFAELKKYLLDILEVNTRVQVVRMDFGYVMHQRLVRSQILWVAPVSPEDQAPIVVEGWSALQQLLASPDILGEAAFLGHAFKITHIAERQWNFHVLLLLQGVDRTQAEQQNLDITQKLAQRWREKITPSFNGYGEFQNCRGPFGTMSYRFNSIHVFEHKNPHHRASLTKSAFYMTKPDILMSLKPLKSLPCFGMGNITAPEQ